MIKLIKVLDVQNNLLVLFLNDFATNGVQQALRFEADKKWRTMFPRATVLIVNDFYYCIYTDKIVNDHDRGSWKVSL